MQPEGNQHPRIAGQRAGVSFLLDCSALLPWVFGDEATEETDQLLDEMARGEEALSSTPRPRTARGIRRWIWPNCTVSPATMRSISSWRCGALFRWLLSTRNSHARCLVALLLAPAAPAVRGR